MNNQKAKGFADIRLYSEEIESLISFVEDMDNILLLIRLVDALKEANLPCKHYNIQQNHNFNDLYCRDCGEQV